MAQFKPNEEQIECISKIGDFVIDNKAFSKLLINGSAGTGKTTILISSIINFINMQIMERYKIIKEAIEKNNLEKLSLINDFIISAPTNKAKDVLVAKYNLYLNALEHSSTLDKSLLIKVAQHKIVFLTVSQVLSISRVINEMGEEEFTKGNEKKVADKYNKPAYCRTTIIIDECSMIDTNTYKILNVIKCPIIFIGDYCQLPPVNEILSPVFELANDVNTSVIRLLKVERCTANITQIANTLRDKIYDIIPDFNLLKNNIDDLVFYKKKQDTWLDVYIIDIKTKQKEMTFNTDINDIGTTNTNTNTNITSIIDIPSNIKNDTMALAWTNKCCGALNKIIRSKLFRDAIWNQDPGFEGIEDIEEHFLIHGDKLLVKSPYYKYNNHIYSSSIVYIARLEKVKYIPLSFKEWCNLATMIEADRNNMKYQPLFDIDINAVLDTTPKSKMQKSLLDYFNTGGDNTDVGNSILAGAPTPEQMEQLQKAEKLKLEKELQKERLLFYRYHNYQDVIATGVYYFKDELAVKYNDICSEFNLVDIKMETTPEKREAKYKVWHQLLSKKIFGIPVERVMCKKCHFFIKKFQSQLNKSCYVADMINATDNICFEMFLTDLTSFTSNGKYISSGIPILDMNVKNNIHAIDIIRDIVKTSYEVKIILSKQDEYELKTINKIMGEDGEATDKSQKYITMSQMFGHYLSHIITSSYLDVDYGYALTVHKSQGSTYDDVYIEYNNLLANKKDTEKHKLLYTAITRSANKLHIYY